MRSVIGIIGGTGKEGGALALRWASAGHRVLLGSRDPAKAAERARALSERAGAPIDVTTNEDAARQAEVAVLSVPYPAHGETVRSLAPALAGKIVLDVTVPIDPKAPTQVRLPPGGAAALEAQAALAGARVVSGLHHVSFTRLESGHAGPDDGDVLVAGDNAAAVERVLGLIRDLGLHGVAAGPLRNAVALESLTPVLLYLNRAHKVRGAGIKVIGLPDGHP